MLGGSNPLRRRRQPATIHRRLLALLVQLTLANACMSDWHGGDWSPSLGLRPHAGGSDWLAAASGRSRQPFAARPLTSHQVSPASWTRPPAGVRSTHTNTCETWASLSALPGTWQAIDRRPNSTIQCWPRASPQTARDLSTPVATARRFAPTSLGQASPMSSGQGTARALSFTPDAPSGPPSPFMGRDRLHTSSSPIGGSWARQIAASSLTRALHPHHPPALNDARAFKGPFKRGQDL